MRPAEPLTVFVELDESDTGGRVTRVRVSRRLAFDELRDLWESRARMRRFEVEFSGRPGPGYPRDPDGNLPLWAGPVKGVAVFRLSR